MLSYSFAGPPARGYRDDTSASSDSSESFERDVVRISIFHKQHSLKVIFLSRFIMRVTRLAYY